MEGGPGVNSHDLWNKIPLIRCFIYLLIFIFIFLVEGCRASSPTVLNKMTLIRFFAFFFGGWDGPAGRE